MDTLPEMALIITTCADADQARNLALALVESRLAACVQTSNILSTYRWKGAIEVANEVRLMIKAQASDYDALEHFIRARHSYENPEIVAVAVTRASEAYLDWLHQETRR